MPEFKKEGRGFKMKGFSPFTKKTDPPKKKKQKDWEPAYMGADYSQEEINRMTEAEKVRNIDGYVDRRKRGTGALGMNEIATEGLGGDWYVDKMDLGEKKKKKKKSPLKKKTDPPKSAEEQMKKLNKKYEKQMGAKIDSIQKVYSKKSQFSADSLNKAVNKDINLYNKGEISQKELKRRRPGVKFK